MGGRKEGTRTLHRMLDHQELEGSQLCEPLVLGVVLFFSLEEVVETVDDAGATAGGVEEAVAGVRFRKGTILAMREIEGYVHMRNTAIRLVIGVDGQEVRIDRSHVLASCLCDHGLQRLEAPLVALKGEQLQAPSAFPHLIDSHKLAYLALIPHQRAQVGRLVPRRGRRVDDRSLSRCWRIEDEGREAGSLVLEDELAGFVGGIVVEGFLGGEEDELGDVGVL